MSVDLQWRKSSYSNAAGEECVEVSTSIPNDLLVRDSKDPDGPVLTYTTDAWRSFVSALQGGDFPASF
ncbi:DUF397 domain-containing protein [Streptomyces sp. NRRL WC-3742]|uniref:DUF397 domain-containing protein n=1 Tax=Streptomyces sp. NRRL WC-3742 TaxID=1463934 RepID=UPI0004C63118|nr:DUF397 domain-containing protein [Streptomyces sp. NRRL WC-3742]